MVWNFQTDCTVKMIQRTRAQKERRLLDIGLCLHGITHRIFPLYALNGNPFNFRWKLIGQFHIAHKYTNTLFLCIQGSFGNLQSLCHFFSMVTDHCHSRTLVRFIFYGVCNHPSNSPCLCLFQFVRDRASVQFTNNTEFACKL